MAFWVALHADRVWIIATGQSVPSLFVGCLGTDADLRGCSWLLHRTRTPLLTAATPWRAKLGC
jgi:hypothetical protein